LVYGLASLVGEYERIAYNRLPFGYLTFPVAYQGFGSLDG
jgi:hypothetical protein